MGSIRSRKIRSSTFENSSRNPIIMTKLFVYGVHSNFPNYKLEKEFSECGDVTDCFNTGKGYAFVTMANEEDAERVIEKMHGAEVDGQEIKVEIAKARAEGDRRGGGGDSEEAAEEVLEEGVEEAFEEDEDVVIVKVDLEVDVVKVDTEVDVVKMDSEVVAEMVTIATRTREETVAIQTDVTDKPIGFEITEKLPFPVLCICYSLVSYN